MSISVLKIYEYAIQVVSRAGYFTTEVASVEKRLGEKFYLYMQREDFFSQYVFVVLCSGFKAEVVERKWLEISNLFSNFVVDIVKDYDLETTITISPIKNKAKIKAILETSQIITDEYLEKLRELKSVELTRNYLIQLPYIGDITVWHLMRNIGIDCFKPDRHIVRLSQLIDVQPNDIFSILKNTFRTEFVGVADVILWRACAILGSADILVENQRRTEEP